MPNLHLWGVAPRLKWLPPSICVLETRFRKVPQSVSELSDNTCPEQGRP